MVYDSLWFNYGLIQLTCHSYNCYKCYLWLSIDITKLDNYIAQVQLWFDITNIAVPLLSVLSIKITMVSRWFMVDFYGLTLAYGRYNKNNNYGSR